LKLGSTLEAWTFVNALMKCHKAYVHNVHLTKPKKTFTPNKTPTPYKPKKHEKLNGATFDANISQH